MDSFPPFCMAEDQMLHYCQIESIMVGGGGGGGAEVAPSCPRCASSNTKFCYYNNYSLTQPRYLCKSCRRYWTRGGSLRNVPIGGGCRKSRRSKAARTAMKTGSMSGRSNKGYYAAGDSLSSDPSGVAEIDMATVFAKFLNQNSSSADSVGQESQQDSDPLPNDADRPRFVPQTEKELEGAGEILDLVENDETALIFPDQLLDQGEFETNQDGLFWSDTTSPEITNFMTWQMESPFPSDELWRSGFDFSGLEVASGSPTNVE